MDALLEKGRMELDPVKRKLVYREAELLMLEDMPLLPCFTSNVHNLMRANTSGFTQLPYSNFADQFGTVQIG
jgi:peptide/nickel transport system substrate-binding protein